jgi:hypothetical protein
MVGDGTIMGLCPLLGDIISGVEGISKISWACNASLKVGRGEGDADREAAGENGSNKASWPGDVSPVGVKG